MTINVTIKYGTGNQIVKQFDHPVTINSVLADSSIRGVLGYGSSVEGYIAGVPQPGDITLRDGDVLSVHDKACTKA